MASLKTKTLMNGDGKKRKRDVEDAEIIHIPPTNLEVDSDGEDSASSDDGEVEPFPELDSGSSDTSSDEGEEEEEEEVGGEHDTDDTEVDEQYGPDGEPPLDGKTVISKITGRPKRVYPEIDPEYDSDSSTEEDPNRVGNIPMHWYDDLPHVGYTIDGKKVLRPARGDELDKFLATAGDPSAWTSAFDKSLQSERPLTGEELDIIRRLYAGENPDAGYDPYEPTVEWFTGKGKEEIMPLSAAPEPKRRFVPSKWEKQKVMKIVRAIRQGRIVPNRPKAADDKPQFFNLWSTPAPDHPAPLPAPKPRLPTNAESYNPPEEYLPTPQEKDEWQNTDKEDRERNYLPQKHPAFRLVPAYADFISERFNRLLDLYLAPRVQRTKLNIDPDSLIPSLPSPQSLRPFPTYLAIRERRHEARVRCLSTSPGGDWVVSGDESGLVSLWESATGHEAARWNLNGKVSAVAWCPRKDVSYFIVCIEEQLHVVIPPLLSAAIHAATRELFGASGTPSEPQPATPSPVKWALLTGQPQAGSTADFLGIIQLPHGSGQVTQITFHRKGDYFASVSSGTGQASVWIHQTSKRHSQAPFKNVKGAVQRVAFHPLKPQFFVATQRYVRLYDLAEQKLVKTFLPGIRWISSLDVHPSGDHFIVGGYDRKLCWFDLELSDKPYKVLRYHSRAIRALHFHPTYPLFASASDDGSIQVFHSRVYHDLMTDPLIVPLKILRGHAVTDGLGVLDVRWLDGLPWLLSGGADGAVGVWCP